jgi:hypothetical protein
MKLTLTGLFKFDNCYAGLSWSNNLNRLFRQSTLSEKERFAIISGIQSPTLRMHRTLHLLNAMHDLDFAYQAVECLKEIECSRVRILGALGFKYIENIMQNRAI